MRFWLQLGVAALAAGTLLWRIDGTVLWRDEATTACWARSMVERGQWTPRVFDGERLIVQAPDGHDFNDRLVPAMQGWLQFYVAALGFLVGGVGTVTARLPFVAAGALALWGLYRLGRVVLGSETAALGLPLLGATSIYFLTAARQARYYILVVLFTVLILLEFARYLEEPERARRWGMWARLGLYGGLTYLANYVSFGGLWIALTVFVVLTRDHTLIRRWVLVSGLLALPMALQFLLVHQEFVAGSAAVLPATWEQWRLTLRYHGTEMFRMLPLAALVPAGWWVFRRDGGSRVARGVALLCGTVLIVSIGATIVAARTGAIPRYYFQVLPAALALTGIIGARLGQLAGRGWAIAYFAFVLVWPNLNFYHNWCEHAVERQLTRDQTCNEPIVEFLRNHVKPNETVAFHRNVQGMMAYFNLPGLRWSAILDADEPRNRRRRAILPAYVFDDWEGVDWYVVWDDRGTKPKKLTADYKLVWEHTYVNPKSWWDWDIPNRVLGYKVYRRSSGGGT